MPTNQLSILLQHWGYGAIFGVVVLGNVGLPVPEETVLALAGYLVWRGELNGPLVVLVGFVSAVAGDNLGYWVGRRLAMSRLRRFAGKIGIGAAQLAKAESFVGRHGAFGVFAARFLPGLRFAAGPSAGALGLPASRFMVANILGAAVYVPTVVTAGYLIGRGLGSYLERLRAIYVGVEWIVLGAAGAGSAILLWRRWRRAKKRTLGS